MSEPTKMPAGVGDNRPPLDDADHVGKRLEREHAALLAEASNLEAESYALPEAPETDADSAKISDFVIRVKRVAKRLDDTRTEAGRPYLEAGRVINALFNDYREPLIEKRTGLADRLTERVTIYNNSKAEKERAERLERERQERARADEARREEQRKRDEAEAAQRRADEAAAQVRAATDKATREAAAAKMREEERTAASARREAETQATTAASAERKADQNERAASAPTGQLGRVSDGGSTSSVSRKWTHTITDAGKLMASLGPLGEYLSNDTISQALARAVRERAAAGSIETFVVPGCRFFQEAKTNITARR